MPIWFEQAHSPQPCTPRNWTCVLSVLSVSSCSPALLLLYPASLMPPPYQVQHATTFKESEWLVTGCQLCHSLTWLCSPKHSPPLSLSCSRILTTPKSGLVSPLSVSKCLISEDSFDFMSLLLPKDPLWLKHDISSLSFFHMHNLVPAFLYIRLYQSVN